MTILTTPTALLTNILTYLDTISYSRLSQSHRVLAVIADKASIYHIHICDICKIDAQSSINRWVAQTHIFSDSNVGIPVITLPHITALCAKMVNLSVLNTPRWSVTYEGASTLSFREFTDRFYFKVNGLNLTQLTCYRGSSIMLPSTLHTLTLSNVHTRFVTNLPQELTALLLPWVTRNLDCTMLPPKLQLLNITRFNNVQPHHILPSLHTLSVGSFSPSFTGTFTHINQLTLRYPKTLQVLQCFPNLTTLTIFVTRGIIEALSELVTPLTRITLIFDQRLLVGSKGHPLNMLEIYMMIQSLYYIDRVCLVFRNMDPFPKLDDHIVEYWREDIRSIYDEVLY